ncbi:MAG: hypothetical protein QOH21_3086 [Acidobacteriota bacterium]|nr:hypothetical protein [Acidobacteriota bacterium]
MAVSALTFGGEDRGAAWMASIRACGVDACRTANRNLTCDEWRNYIGANKPDLKTCEALPGPRQLLTVRR